jgi:hypothetical protein
VRPGAWASVVRTGIWFGVSALPRAITLLFLLAPWAAWAGERARIEVSRDDGAMSCPDEKQLSDAIASRLGYEPFSPDAELRIAVRFFREGRTFRGVVEMHTAGGESKGARALASGTPDCQELAETAALTISILLDPRSGLNPHPPLPMTTPQELPDLSRSQDPRAPTASRLEAIPAPPRDRAPSLRPRLAAHATGSVNLLPAPTLGVLASAGIEARRWSMDGELRIDTAGSNSYGRHDVSASFAAGALAPCARFGFARACGLVVLGAVQAEVVGASQGKQSAFVLLVGPRLGISLPINSWLSFDAHVDLLYAPTQMTVRLDGVDLWETHAISGLLGIGFLGCIP